MKHGRSRELFVATACAMGLALACAAPLEAEPSAATTGDAPSVAGSQGGIEEIVVTARRKEESLQSVPVSITR